jgi:hypothetical protein
MQREAGVPAAERGAVAPIVERGGGGGDRKERGWRRQ